MSHFYVVSVSSPSGGAPKDVYYVYNSLDSIKKALQKDLEKDPYQLLWYGEEIILITFIDDESISEFSLLPYIRATIEGYPESWFNEKGEIQGFKPNHNHYSGTDEEYEKAEALMMKLCENTIPVDIRVNWDAMTIPPLPAKGRLKKGKKVVAQWNDDEWEWGYGLNDTEANIEGDDEDDE